MAALGALCRAARDARGMSLQDVASQAGLTKSHVWEVEQGRTANPTVKTLVGLSIALRVSDVMLFRAAQLDHAPTPVSTDSARSSTLSRKETQA